MHPSALIASTFLFLVSITNGHNMYSVYLTKFSSLMFAAYL